MDALGNPNEILLTTGYFINITVGEKYISQIDFNGATILPDKAYGKWVFREFIANHAVKYCIPLRKDNTDLWYADWWLYKEHRIIETFFLNFKDFGRIVTRFD